MKLTSELLVFLASMGGALVGGGVSVALSWVNQRAETRRHLAQLALEVATKSWERHFESKRQGLLAPLENFMIHSALMSELVYSGRKITPAETKRHLERTRRVMELLRLHTQQMTNEAAARARS